MLTQHHYRAPATLSESVLAPASALACPSTKPRGSLGVVSPGDSNAVEADSRLAAIVASHVQAVATTGHVPVVPLQEQVVVCLAEWPDAARATALSWSSPGWALAAAARTIAPGSNRYSVGPYL